MAEIWGAAIMVGGAIAKGASERKKAKEDRKNAKEDTLEGTKYQAMLSQFENEQDYYYNQLERSNKKRGLDEFRKFSTLGGFAPQYQNDNTGPVLPDKPNAEETFKAPEKAAGGNKGKSTLEKIDPLGSKILGGLF